MAKILGFPLDPVQIVGNPEVKISLPDKFRIARDTLKIALPVAF